MLVRAPNISTLVVIMLAISPAALQAATNETSPRVTRSAHGFESERGESKTRDPESLVESIAVPSTRHRVEKGKSTSTLAAVGASDAWFYDASTELFYDDDGDGYYHYLRVRFDVDSYYENHWVYARLFVSEDGYTWEEYHVTGDFLVNGSSPFDDFEVETELVSGFPPSQYDVLIELYDADFGDFLAEFGPADSSAFSLLPLEDISYDEPPIVIVTEGYGGGGSADVWVVAFLAAFLLARAIASRRAKTGAKISTRAKCRRRPRHSFDRTL